MSAECIAIEPFQRTTRRCLWCAGPFEPRRPGGGRGHVHCSERCRLDFYAAARVWVLAEIGAGRLDIGNLRRLVESRGLADKQKVVDPPLLVADEGAVKGLRTAPGQIIYARHAAPVVIGRRRC